MGGGVYRSLECIGKTWISDGIGKELKPSIVIIIHPEDPKYGICPAYRIPLGKQQKTVECIRLPMEGKLEERYSIRRCQNLVLLVEMIMSNNPK